MRTAAKISRQPIGKWDMGGNKMIAITACAAALAAVTEGLLLRSGYEKKHFVTDQYEIESPKLPDGAAFRCVFLSDLHDNVYGTDNEPLVAAIRAFKPDAVLIGGDMMICKGKGDLTVTVSLLEKLTSFVPVYYANGNHEERMNRERYRDLKRRAFWAVVLAIPVVVIGMFFMDMPYGGAIMALLSAPVVFWLGRGFFVNAWQQLRHRSATMDTLVALSTGIAYLFSLFNLVFPEFWLSRGVEPHVYFEAAAVIIAFILLGRTLEEKAKGDTTASLKKLIGLQPKNAIVVAADGTQTEIPISRIRVGDLLAVRPGEKIAVDGAV